MAFQGQEVRFLGLQVLLWIHLVRLVLQGLPNRGEEANTGKMASSHSVFVQGFTQPLHPDATSIDFHSKHRVASVVFASLLTASGQGMSSISFRTMLNLP